MFTARMNFTAVSMVTTPKTSCICHSFQLRPWFFVVFSGTFHQKHVGKATNQPHHFHEKILGGKPLGGFSTPKLLNKHLRN